MGDATPSTSKMENSLNSRSLPIEINPERVKKEINTQTQNQAFARQLGSWALNKNKLKELGIESSVLSALNKLKVNKQGKSCLQVSIF